MVATDVLSLSDAKRVVSDGIGPTGNDDKIAAYVTAVSQRLDAACGPIVRRQVAEMLDGGNWWVRTRTAPIVSFTSVTEHTSGSPAVLTAETAAAAGDYLAEPFDSIDPADLFSGKLRRRSGFRDFPWACGRRNIVVVAQAGRYGTTADVTDTRFAQAARILLKHLWSSETLNVAQAGEYEVPFPSFPRTMPMIIRQLLAADWREGLAVA